MTAPLQTGEGVFFDFSGRTKLRVTGSDRLRFLNGQITNDVRKATESAAIEGCVLNAKGKINAHVFVSAGPTISMPEWVRVFKRAENQIVG